MIRHDSEYVGLFAEFYDMLHSDLSDVQTYVSWAQEYGPSVLELGSGTGRILLPMVRAGVEVTGIELSEDMLRLCRQKLEKETREVRNRVTLVHGDMREIQLGKQYDLIIAPCNVLNHFLNTEELLGVLCRVREHLKAVTLGCVIIPAEW